MERVCQLTEITPATIEGVSTFYTQFRHRPVGKHIVSVCHGTACHVKGSELVQDAFQRHLKIPSGGDTDPQGLFTVQKVACLGCCTLAPVIQIDDVTYGHLTSQKVGEAVEEFLAQGSHGRPSDLAAVAHDGPRGEIRVGLGSCCVAQGSGKVHETIARTIGRHRRGGRGETGRLRGHVPPDAVGGTDSGRRRAVEALLPRQGRRRPGDRAFGVQAARHLAADEASRDRWLDRLVSDETPNAVIDRAIDVRDRPVCAFLGPQKHLATEYCGQIDPTDLDEYLRHDGFKALRHCLETLSPEEIIDQVRWPAFAAAAGPVFPRRKNGRPPARPPATRSTSSATATRATPARSWTACCWSRSLTASSRAWPSPPRPSAPRKAFSISAPNTRWRFCAYARRSTNWKIAG